MSNGRYRRGTSKVADGHELQNLDSQTETADPPAQEETNENDTTVYVYTTYKT